MPRYEDRSVSDVFQDIFGNIQEIVRSEVRLAKADFRAESGRVAKAGKDLAIGGVLALYAGGLILLALVYGLSLLLPIWLAALGVGATVSVFALSLINTGLGRLRALHGIPERSPQIAKEITND